MTETEILHAAVSFHEQPFVTPLVLSTGPITEITEARAEVRVRAAGREGTGRGSIYLSDLWAWPDPSKTHAERDAALRAYCETIARNLPAWCGGEAAHPLELGLRLHAQVHDYGQDKVPPVLARAMCASPFDAAVHDATGHVLGRTAFALYDGGGTIPSADPLFPETGACMAVLQALRRPPRQRLDAWLVVGKNDNEAAVRPWVTERRYRCFKLKIMGKVNAEDVERTREVYRMVTGLGAREPVLSVDTNEANPDADSVRDYLEQLRVADPEAYAALRFIEQPTGRDIRVHAFDWRGVTGLKPVMLDEGLTSLELLEEAARQGWSGFALKTCKGHSFALVAAAWADQNGMLVSMQDLTNPGYAAIHAALFAGHLDTINGVELNAAQYTPEANSPWLPRLQPLLAPTDGRHRLPEPVPPGLGSTL